MRKENDTGQDGGGGVSSPERREGDRVSGTGGKKKEN